MATNGQVHQNGNGVNGNDLNGTAKTGIKVIVVGAGFGGLGAAIECHRQGHDVEIYEAFAQLKQLGDIISFGPNAGRIFYRWSHGEITRRMRKLSIDLRTYGFNIHKYDTGEIVINQKTPQYGEETPVFNGHRGELHEVVFDYATKELGIPIHLDNRIENYFEDDGGAGIVLANGERVGRDPGCGKQRKMWFRMLTDSPRSPRTWLSQRMVFDLRLDRRSSATKISPRVVAMQYGEHGEFAYKTTEPPITGSDLNVGSRV